MFGKIFKYSLLGLTAWVVVANASPAYREAWKAKKAADLAVAKSSASSTRREVEQAFRKELEAQGCKPALENLSVDTTKEDGKWVINGDISMRRRIYGDVSVNYDFSVSSSRRSLWQ